MTARELLERGLLEMGLEATTKQIDDFFLFKALLIEWNEKINLTAITEEREVVIKHFLDSLACLKAGVDFSNKKILDLGTGGGFPGVPLKIYDRTIDMTLLDSLNKRINYLKIVGESLEFDKIHYVHSRAEDGGINKLYREQYDIVVSRAVANMSTLVEYCLPYVKVGGYFIAQKTMEASEEIEAAKKAIAVLGGTIEEIIPGEIPFSDLKHNLVRIRKVSSTPKQYPRKAGTPSKSPIK